MSLRLMPVSITEARAFVERVHSHHGAPITGLFAVGVCEEGRLCCVGIAGRPVARMLAAAGCCEVTRVASDHTKHAASMTVAALARAALALGYTRVVSYTVLGESGVSYRAAGWWPTAITAGLSTRNWSSHTTHPGAAAPAQPGSKVRWEFGPGALPRDAVLLAQVDASIRPDACAPRAIVALPLFARVSQ
jgi:hypothetical protein